MNAKQASSQEANVNTKKLVAKCVLLVAYLLTASSVRAQCSFSSGSTGTNGFFNPTNSMPSTGWSSSGNVVTVTNSADGFFHFTGVTISNIWTVKFTRNALNTPVHILATNDVTINGTIDLTGSNATTNQQAIGGPGGFDGGVPSGTGFDSVGFGPGAATNVPSYGGAGYGLPVQGPAYGVIDILPAIGGSGGSALSGGGGGAGGGALLIASSTKITVNGSLKANGSNAGHGSAGNASGGAIRLVANTIAGEGPITAQPGVVGQGVGGIGRIRLEACTLSRTSLTAPPATFGPPGIVSLSLTATNPTIRVGSIQGNNTPAIPTGSLSMPDVSLLADFVNPALIKVTASNINVGTTFKVIVTPIFGTNMIATNALVGTYAFSSNTVSMSVYTDRVWRVNALIDYIQRP